MQSISRDRHRVSISISCTMLMFLASDSASCGENSTSAIPKKYVSAVIKCEQRLKLAPDNLALRKTLVGHYIKIAQSLKSDPYEAIKFLHKADLLEPDNQSVTDNLNTIIRKMSKNPLSFSDRAEIAAMARRQADFTTAIGEYLRALQIKPSGSMHEQLGDIYRVRDENDKAIEQYIKAQSFGDSKGLEVKLGQAYQAKKDIVSAVAAYAKAVAMKSDDPLEQEALVAGWEEALKSVLHQDATTPLDSSAQPHFDFTDLSNRIKGAWLPPKRADFKTAKLSAKFSVDGGMADLKIVSSSGDSSFDRSAVRALERLKKTGHGLVLPASVVDGSTSTAFTVEFQHIIGGPKIVLVTL
ncbi:MAG: TonB C-terminal domain-containing protein [Candidatus Obscuribacterales bacterium]